MLQLYDKRLPWFIIVSCSLHLALVFSLPKLYRSPSLPMKKPVLVDLMDISGPSSKPAHSPPAAMKRKSSPRSTQSLAKKTAPRSDVSPKTSGTTTLNSLEDSSLPNLDELIPTLTRLLDGQQTDATPIDMVHLQEGMDKLLADARYQEYLLELKHRVKKNWDVNPSTEFRQGTTVVWVIVAADGTLWSVDLLKPSGMILHDYEALDAVKRAFPLRPPPKSLLNNKGLLPIRFSFHYLISPSS